MSEKKYVDMNGLLYVWSKIKLLIEGKVSGQEVDTKISVATADMATKTYVNERIASINKKTIVTSLEAMTDSNTIYLMANSGKDNNVYDEYLVIDGTPEKIGTTETDLSNCVKNEDLVAITNAEIDEMFEV